MGRHLRAMTSGSNLLTKLDDLSAANRNRFDFTQLKTINSTESARESNSRSKDTKPRKRGCFQPDD
jgi:hypothetical protein